MVVSLFLGMVSLNLDRASRIWPAPLPELRLASLDGLVRLLPLILTFGGVMLMVMAHGLRRTFSVGLARLMPPPLLATLALLLMMVGGSLYARKVNGTLETFLVAGLMMLNALLLHWTLLLSPNRSRLVNLLHGAFLAGTAILATSFTATALDRINPDGSACEFLPVIFLASYMAWFRWPIAMVRVPTALVTLGLCMLTFKKTGVICFGTFLGPLLIDWALRRYGATAKTLSLVVGALALLAAATYGIGIAMTDAYRSGAANFREFTFNYAWNQFTESPVWGQLYTFSSAIYHPQISQWVPTHNDLLDVLRMGGVLGMALFLLATCWPLGGMLRHLKDHGHASPLLLAATASSIVSFAVFAFNPVMTSSDIAGLYWAIVGLSWFAYTDHRSTLERQATNAWRHR